MSASLDLLALILLVSLSILATFLRIRFLGEEDVAVEEAEREVFFRQRQFDPATLALPLTGLQRERLFRDGCGAPPWEMAHLLVGEGEPGALDAPGRRSWRG